MADDDEGYTLDFGSIIRLRRVCEKVEAAPMDRLISRVPTEATVVTPSKLVNLRALQFRNDSDYTCPRGGCLRITGMTTTGSIGGQATDLGEPVLTCTRPDATFGQYVISANEVASGAYGKCYDMGDVLFSYTTGTPALNEAFGPKPSNFGLFVGFPGLIHCYGRKNATQLLAYGHLTPVTTMLGKSVTALVAATSYTTSTNIKIYGGTFGSEADCGFTTMPTMRSRTAIASGKWIKLTLINGHLEVEPLEC